MSILGGVAGGVLTRSYGANLRAQDNASSASGGDGNTSGTDVLSGPSDTVELSGAARLRLERIEADKAAADNLAKALADQSSSEGTFRYRGKDGEQGLELYKARNPDYASHEVTVDDAIRSLNRFASVTESSNPVLAARFKVGPDFDPEAMLNEIARQGDFDTVLFRKHADEGPEAFLTPFSSRPNSKEEAAAVDAASQLSLHYTDLQRAGLNDEAAAFRDAIENGGLRFQSIDKVDNLNASYQYLQARAASGGTNGRFDLDLDPAGDTKDALEAGDALTVQLGDLGAYYVTY